MGIRYQCDATNHWNITVWQGTVTPQEWAEHVDRVLADPCFMACTRFLADLQGLATDALTVADVDATLRPFLAALPRPGARIAMVAGEDWKLTTHAELLALESNSAIVFNDLSTALTWLGLDATAGRDVVAELRAEIRRAESN